MLVKNVGVVSQVDNESLIQRSPPSSDQSPGQLRKRMKEMTEEMMELKKKVRLQENKLDNLRRKLDTRQKGTRRLKQKVDSLQSVIKSLKDQNLITEHCESSLTSSLSGVPQELFKRITKNPKGKVCKSKYPEELMSFALTLQFYSAKAYDYVRRKLNLALPHPRHLRFIYSKIDADPGTYTLNNDTYCKKFLRPIPKIRIFGIRKVDWYF